MLRPRGQDPVFQTPSHFLPTLHSGTSGVAGRGSHTCCIGGGQTAWHGAHNREVRKGPGRPRVTDEERHRKWSHRQGGRAGRDTERVQAKPIMGLERGEQYNRTPVLPCTPIPLPLAGSTCLPEGTRWGGALESIAFSSKPAREGETQNRPASCSVQRRVGHREIDRCGPHRCMGHAFTKRVWHRYTPSEFWHRKFPKSGHSTLPHSLSPCPAS